MDSTKAPTATGNGQQDPKTDLTTRHKPSRGGWNAAIFVIFVEMAERFAFYGLAGNLISFLTNVFHESTATAAKNVNTWIGVSCIFPLLGAFIADSYLGRFKTILISSFIFLVGTVVLTLSVSLVPWHHRKVVFFIALYTLAIGEGGHKPCVQTFAADQFDESTPQEIKAKNSFFNWWFLGIVVGATSGVSVEIYIQEHVGWGSGYAILAVTLAAALGLFLLGTTKYRKERPLGSPFTRVAQVVVAAAKKRSVRETRDGRGTCYEEYEMDSALIGAQTEAKRLARTNQFRFLDKAMIIDDTDASSQTRNPWRLCTLNQVEEVKMILRLIPIWLSCLMFNAVQSTLHTFFTKQGSTMIRSIGPHFQLPAASLQSIPGFTILIIMPIYDKIFVPIARKFTRNPTGITMLQRIGVGLFLSILNMVSSALVEDKRVKIAKEHNLLDNPKAEVPISLWWLLPQYILCGISDVFAVVGLQQLFYDQVPEGMKSVGAAAYVSLIGVGNFVSAAVIAVVVAASKGKWLGSNNLNRSHLDDFYWLLGGLSSLALCVYVVVAKQFVYKKVEQVTISEEKKETSMREHINLRV